MTPARNRKSRRTETPVRAGPKATDVHDVVYYKAADGSMPAKDYIDSCPAGIRAQIRAVAAAVAAAPPTRFAGGGKWEAMHDSMTGWFEIRIDGPPKRSHYRVFCLLDTNGKGAARPYLVLVDGRTKAFQTTLHEREYMTVRALGDHYRATQPRPIG